MLRANFGRFQNAGDFGIDRGGEREYINLFRAKQCAFRDAVRLECRTYDG